MSLGYRDEDINVEIHHVRRHIHYYTEFNNYTYQTHTGPGPHISPGHTVRLYVSNGPSHANISDDSIPTQGDVQNSLQTIGIRRAPMRSGSYIRSSSDSFSKKGIPARWIVRRGFVHTRVSRERRPSKPHRLADVPQ